MIIPNTLDPTKFTQLSNEDEKKVIGGIAISAIISGLLSLIFGIPILQKMASSDEGKVKLPLGISGEWNSTSQVEKEIVHSQTVSPTFYN